MAEGENFDFPELFPVVDVDDDDDKTCIDLQMIMKILDEDPGSVEEQCSPVDSSLKNVSPGESGTNSAFQLQNGPQVLEEPIFSGFDFVDSDMGNSPVFSVVSDSGARVSVGLSVSAANSVVYHKHENQEPPSQDSSSPSAFSGSYRDSLSLGGSDDISYTGRMGGSKSEIPAYSVETSFPEAYSNNISVHGDDLHQSTWKGENKSQFIHMGEDAPSENASHSSIIDNGDVNFEDFVKDTIGGVSGHQENESCTSFEISVMDANTPLHVATSTDSAFCQGSHVPSDASDYYLSSKCYQGTGGSPFVADSSLAFLPGGISSQLWTNDGTMSNTKAENVEFYGDMSHVSSGMYSSSTEGASFQDSQLMLTDSGFPSFFSDNVIFEDKASVPLSACASYMSYGDQSLCLKDERNELSTLYQNSLQNGDAKFNVGQDMKQLCGAFPSMEYQRYEFKPEDNHTVTSSLANHKQDVFNGTVRKFQGNMGDMNLKAVDKPLPYAQASIVSEKQFGCVKREGGGRTIQLKHISSHLSKGSAEIIRVEDDSDVCIIEDISHPVPTRQYADIGNSLGISHSSSYVDSRPSMAGSTRVKACDERNILRVALQDLSQPKSEVSPPDGLLAVPLLRHQRIALSWMIKKETSSLYCSGGILADDQGLGKTVSTISLILTEKPPTHSVCTNAPKGELETLNLDVDDDMLSLNDGVMKECRYPVKSTDLLMQAKGRPSGGTLVVCPTSVLRQWAEELRNKVTSQANLSVLVFHGSNRTKDPYEVAKYDVVVTTYSIVGMEVPKQPLVDKDEEKGGFEDLAVPSRKRKEPSNSNRNGKKGMSNTVLEAVARPLAKVAWFRVVLDEAQSIKNYKTQVARACWGLRAKRRWCLSGTPIQNSIDDLYSYFRFLRYDPYAVHSSFCFMIKNPINRNPTKGYRKLQAVLKTIMLRRTKGTLLDGEPIISLPPKSVELKKVDFSREERDFYSRLEADSRAQFQEYANAGTVKQNYVNILLMLLRLRQACDHPLLVNHYNSDPLWRSSVEMAKKIPQEKQISLLNCLEASLALCGICNDPPEDAVVSVCGHVFCNQCISEHLTGDDNQCPATNCRTGLSTSKVFSKDTLKSCLSEKGCDNLPGCSGSKVEESEPWFQSQPYDSSKIKAALEVLQSLCKAQRYTPKSISAHSTTGENIDCSVNSCDSNIGRSFKNFPENHNLSLDRSSKESTTVLGEKAIVFSQWTRMLDLLEECLKKFSIQYRRLDGTMSVVARDKAVKDFNTLPEVSVMIMSLKAASLGLNMVAACHVLMLDLWWNPTTEDQAIDRAHRIGQTRPVTVLRLTVRDTVEDRILALQQKKRKMVASAFGEDGTGGTQSRLTVDDLKYLFMM
ncbi:PREDICTED: helicase-like transcription factor CHR28 isoform X1 [Lupinus angustifolius]|uniref:helicase-like transcription factor CHR28 isoform X1 n=1 Tax=Lupinus angustifolius TaxID=3871 RepID=UPI00092EC8DC|nr:PREDICTED: helicase-like transcription factor CHR28 isoform X1 [Lupinus angustifolius]